MVIELPGSPFIKHGPPGPGSLCKKDGVPLYEGLHPGIVSPAHQKKLKAKRKPRKEK